MSILLSTWQGRQKINMGRTKYTTTHLLWVKELLQAGFSTREIATKLSINKSSIAELAKWVPESEYVKRMPGRTLLLSLHQQALLTRGISKNSYTLATEASAYWLQHYQLCLSRQTITCALKQAGLKFRAKRRKPLLTDKHRKARRVFAKEYRHWTVEQWKNVIWSDECKVQHIGKGLKK